jgi:hypothetical protein
MGKRNGKGWKRNGIGCMGKEWEGGGKGMGNGGTRMGKGERNGKGMGKGKEEGAVFNTSTVARESQVCCPPATTRWGGVEMPTPRLWALTAVLPHNDLVVVGGELLSGDYASITEVCGCCTSP